jgi:hypothetical protein
MTGAGPEDRRRPAAAARRSPAAAPPRRRRRGCRADRSGQRRLSCGTSVRCPAPARLETDDVHVVLDRLPRDLFRGLEQRADVDVEAEVGERRGDDLLAAVVAVLAHLGDEDSGAAALVLQRRPRRGAAPVELGVWSPHFLSSTPRRCCGSSACADRRPPQAPSLISPTVALARAASTAGEQVAFPCGRGLRERLERACARPRLVTLGLERGEFAL